MAPTLAVPGLFIILIKQTLFYHVNQTNTVLIIIIKQTVFIVKHVCFLFFIRREKCFKSSIRLNKSQNISLFFALAIQKSQFSSFSGLQLGAQFPVS